METGLPFPLVPKLRLGDVHLGSSASPHPKWSFEDMGSQAGAWELEEQGNTWVLSC